MSLKNRFFQKLNDPFKRNTNQYIKNVVGSTICVKVGIKTFHILTSNNGRNQNQIDAWKHTEHLPGKRIDTHYSGYIPEFTNTRFWFHSIFTDHRLYLQLFF